VRAGLVSDAGELIASATSAVSISSPLPEHFEQSSAEIWAAVCSAVRQAVDRARTHLPDLHVGGIGFDATCSLVVLDRGGNGLSVTAAGDSKQQATRARGHHEPEPLRDVIMWMDHRAVSQAAAITASAHAALQSLGGSISPEMDPPKLLWLKQRKPDIFSSAGHFMSLTDYLSYKATGDTTRSICTTTCKWTYQPSRLSAPGVVDQTSAGWDPSFWQTVGLGELVTESFARIGSRIAPIGSPIGRGLTEAAALELGLATGTPVAAGLIDAHAGGVGMLGAILPGQPVPMESRLALICGTSSCHMALCLERRPVPGVWGPYFSAMVPGCWLLEGGQSATVALLDHIISQHPAYHLLRAELGPGASPARISALLNERLDSMAQAACLPFSDLLTAKLHIYPDFHGNRSPKADPNMRGMICGLMLTASTNAAQLDDLALQYLATLQAVACGTRHILEALADQGVDAKLLFVCGGLANNPLFLQTHADVTRRTLILPAQEQAMVVGAAVAGAAAAQLSAERSPDPSRTAAVLVEVMRCMNRSAGSVTPREDPQLRRFYDGKYRVHKQMAADQLRYRAIMSE